MNLKFQILCFSVALFSIGFCSPIKSSVGSRSSILFGPNEECMTAESYIKFGLIAMFDGIENVGFLSHDTDSRIWINLAGDENQSIKLPGAMYNFTENSLRMESNGGASGITSYVVPVPYDSWTAEIVCRVVSMPSPPSAAGFFCSVNRTTLRFPYILTNQNQMMTSYYAGIGQASLFLYPVGGTEIFSASVTSDLENSTVKFFKNGNRSSTRTGTCTRLAVSEMNLFESRSSGWSAGTVLEIFSIRIYARTLSEKEIFANSVIDRKRFGI